MNFSNTSPGWGIALRQPCAASGGLLGRHLAAGCVAATEAHRRAPASPCNLDSGFCRCTATTVICQNVPRAVITSIAIPAITMA
jgi:hypothetical protein